MKIFKTQKEEAIASSFCIIIIFTGCYRFNEKWPVTSLFNPVFGSIYSALNQ